MHPSGRGIKNYGNGRTASGASSTSKNEHPQEKITPFGFLETISPDLVAIIHAVILSGLPSFDKHDICMKVLVKDAQVFNKYNDWKRAATKSLPPNSLNSLPGDVQEAIRRHVEYLDYAQVQEMCSRYPKEMTEIKAWLDTILDQKEPMKYLDVVFSRARTILDEFLASGKTPSPESVKRSPSPSKELKIVPAEEPPVPVRRTTVPPVSTITMSILLLGETGMGKTTFINSMVNQLVSSFDQLMASDSQPKILVNTSFTVFNTTDRKSKTVAVMADEKYRLEGNEVLTNGSSSTQDPVTYRYSWMDGQHEKILQIIDTPGVNDTRGAAQDDANFDLILRHVKKMGKLDAICVLLKPNETKFSQPFRYCLNNLVLRLHRNATKNVIFCFTHCRATMYKPGESLNTLQNYLSQLKQEKRVDIKAIKDNIFCFDNDCFRYILTAKVFPALRTDSDDKIFAEGWGHNAMEIKRFLAKVLAASGEEQVTPEERKARGLIEKMAPFLARAVVTLEKEKRTLEDHLEKFDKLMKKEQKDFKDQKKQKQSQLATVEAESQFIQQACVQLSAFLNYHSTYSEADPYEKAMIALIKREEEFLKEQREKKRDINPLLCYTLQAIVYEHIENVKRAIERVQINTHMPLAVDEVNRLIANLTSLRITGHIIASGRRC